MENVTVTEGEVGDVVVRGGVFGEALEILPV